MSPPWQCLSKLQEEFLAKAAFGGMTPAETKEYDKRLEKLGELKRAIEFLERQQT